MNVSQLRQAIQDLRPVEGNSIWDNHRRKLRERILNDDPERFLTWSTIIGTMFVGNAPWTPDELDVLPGEIYAIIGDPGFGEPVLYNGWTSGNYIHQAYHLNRWQRLTGLRIKDMGSVVEIGGGYGTMAVIVKRLGYPDNSYTIADLPEFSLLQEYYLSNTIGLSGIMLTNGIGQPCDLLIASHSLNEMTIDDREWILNNIKAESYLFVFHCKFDGVDNLAYFTGFMKDHPEYNWQQWVTPHLPNQIYQVGWK